MNIDKIRVNNLNFFIKTNFKNLREFTENIGINYGNIFAVLHERRPFGERLARDIEKKLSLPFAFLDQLKQNNLSRVFNIPIVKNKLSAGHGTIVFKEEVIDYLELSETFFLENSINYKGIYIFQVQGDSMQPTLLSGCRVLVNTLDVEVLENKVYAVSINDEIFIKRLVYNNKNELVLHSDNSNFSEIIIDGKHKKFNIIGKVVYVLGQKVI